MAIDLTTPVPVANIEYQGITKFEFNVPHFCDTENGNAMKFDKPNIDAVFIVTTWDGNGNVIKTQRYRETFENWPAAFLTDVAAVYNKLEAYAINQGYIGAGIGEVVEPAV